MSLEIDWRAFVKARVVLTNDLGDILHGEVIDTSHLTGDVAIFTAAGSIPGRDIESGEWKMVTA